MKEPWDQIRGEDDEAYAAFLIYRNIGMRRTLRKAYCHFLETHDGYTGGHKELNLPRSWRAASVSFFWKERATAWDIRNLHSYGARLAVLHTRAVTTVAEKCVRLSYELNPGDDGWADLLDSMDRVQNYLSPEVVKGIAERNKSTGPAPLPAHVGTDDGVS